MSVERAILARDFLIAEQVLRKANAKASHDLGTATNRHDAAWIAFIEDALPDMIGRFRAAARSTASDTDTGDAGIAVLCRNTSVGTITSPSSREGDQCLGGGS